MHSSVRDRQARSRAAWAAYFIGLVLLFFAGLAGGMWVSLRYFDTPVALTEPAPAARAPGRITGGLAIPTWIDHPFRRRENSYLGDYAYRTAMSDLNAVFFGEAAAAVPSDGRSLAEEYESRKIRGLINADDERAYHDRFSAESRATLERIGRYQGARADRAARAIGEREDLASLRVPGTVLYLAATAFSGRPMHARLGANTSFRSQTVSKDDYRFQVDHDLTDFGFGIGSAYDSIDRRRTFTFRQSFGPAWAIGVDRTLSSVESRAENVFRLQFAAPF